MSKIVVVGANHAGTAAINTMLDNYSGNEVVVLERNFNTSFLGCGMALWIGDQIQGGGEGLFYSSPEQLREKGAKVSINTEVEKIDFDKKIIYYSNKEDGKVEESYDKLILATGSLPIIPPIPGRELENVQQVKLYQDAQAVIEKLELGGINHVTVVGSGYIGVELAEAFKRKGKEVALLDIADGCLTGYYDPEFSNLMKQNLIDNGIDCKFGQALEEIKGDKKVEAVKTSNEEFATDMVILCVGFRPNTELGKGKLEQFKNGAYIVNKKQETSVKDVYAIGDCATVYDNAVDGINYIALATNAVRSGIIAAHNACGTAIESIGVQGSNGISIYGLHLISTGLTAEKAAKFGYEVETTSFEDNQRPEFMKENDIVKIKIVYDKKTRRVLGMQCASRYDMSMVNHMFSLAIQEHVTIDRIALLDIFFLPHFNKPYNYITMAALTAK
ncbi:MAG: FAD-dependent oxidoreductase [[Eubacterium] brachy]|nr:FAD-dependent oxidoreductase [[Eubacterium] brachy]